MLSFKKRTIEGVRDLPGNRYAPEPLPAIRVYTPTSTVSLQIAAKYHTEIARMTRDRITAVLAIAMPCSVVTLLAFVAASFAADCWLAPNNRYAELFSATRLFSATSTSSQPPDSSGALPQRGPVSPSQTNQRGGRNRGDGIRMGGGGGVGPGDNGGGPGGEPQSVRADYPQWEIEKPFRKDVFTFVRIQYDSLGGRGGFGGWRNDYPDCDWNFSVRLQQLTTMKVDPNGRTLRLTEPELFNYPFVFMTNMGSMNLSNEEQLALRNYLLQGGFLMADDFWAASEWRHIRTEMKRVLPDREPEELNLNHEIFHLVYNFAQLPQVPSIRAWQRGLTYEDWHGPYDNDDTSPHFWGYYDDNRRLIALFCHNNDVADGWEREGEEIEYFQRYSLKYSYPFGINIITYAMTH